MTAITRDKQDIAIVGCMASGKSTIAKLLSDKLGYKYFEENFTGNPYLERYYEDPRRWAFANEVWFMMEKAQQSYNIAWYQGSTVQDSPLVSVVYFSAAMRNAGCLDLEDYSLIVRAFNYIYDVTPKPTDFVYLKVHEDVVMDRIKSRGRAFEQSEEVGREYIKESIDNIETLLNRPNYDPRRYIHSAITVDGNQSPDDVVKDIIKEVT